MRFFGAFFLGVCYANAEGSTEPVRTTLIPEVANPPKETQASVDARLALVAVCPEATSDCSVPTGREAENEELADALDCMLKINVSSIPAGPCHDALKQFLDDHLNPANRVPQGVSPTMLIMRSQPGPSPLAEILQRMAANSRPAPQPMPMMFPFQDPRFQQSYPQNSRGQSYGQSYGNLPMHGFPPMHGGRGQMERDGYNMRSRDQGSYSRNRNSRNSNNRNKNNRNRHSGEEEGHWDYVWHSTRNEPRQSRSGRGSRQHQMPPPPPHPMPSSSRRMPSSSRHMPSRMPPHMPPRMPSSPPRQMSIPSRSPWMSSSSSSMNPMMMMLLPHLMGQESSQKSPMSGIMMATLMKNMASSGYDDYDYDYGYDYDYDDDDEYDDDATDDYDYDYDYEDEPAPSPFASLIQKMLQQKLAARQAAIQGSLSEPAQIVDAPSPLEDGPTAPVEIAQPPRARSDKEIRTEQVSYRSAP